MREEVYERLVDTLVQVGGAIPVVKCPELITLLKELFTPEEAALAAAMPLGVNSVEAISGSVGSPGERIVPLLESMADKALVFHQLREGTAHYKLMPLLPGFFEFQFMKGGTTEHDHKMARLFKAYFDKMEEFTAGANLELMRKITPFSRVIPVRRRSPGEARFSRTRPCPSTSGTLSTYPFPPAIAVTMGSCWETLATSRNRTAWPSVPTPSLPMRGATAGSSPRRRRSRSWTTPNLY